MKIYYIRPSCTKDNKFRYSAYIAMLVCMHGITTNANTLDKMDKTCEGALKVGQRIGYWICIFMCVYEIVKKVKDGDTNAIWGIIVKYGIAYGAVFIVRFVLDMIGEWFA
nr:hypothetical protein [uncultured Cellulosilyticum sp.]